MYSKDTIIDINARGFLKNGSLFDPRDSTKHVVDSIDINGEVLANIGLHPEVIYRMPSSNEIGARRIGPVWLRILKHKIMKVPNARER